MGCFVKLPAAIFGLLLAATPLSADGTIDVPSGQLVIPYKVLWEDHVNEGAAGESWLILRFLTPEIARAKGKISFGDATPDLKFLCSNVGLPMVDLTGGGIDKIIINFLDRPIPRGERDPETTQFMNAYRIVKGVCRWE